MSQQEVEDSLRRLLQRGPGPNSPLPGITGPGGGRISALVLSRYVKPNTGSTTSYNHYSLLASIEDIFGPGRQRVGRRLAVSFSAGADRSPRG